MNLLLLICTCSLAADPIKDPAPKDFAKFLDQTLEEFTKQQKAYDEKWGIAECERWSVDQDKGTITFINTKKGHKKVVAKFQIIGSFNSADDTWLWGWANSSVKDQIKKDALQLKRYGEKNNLMQLTDRKWEGKLDDAWKMTALAAKLLGAEAGFRGPSGKLNVFMTIRDLKEVKD